MGRRSIIEKCGPWLQERIIEMYFVEGKSVRDITHALKQEGILISHSAVHRYVKKIKPIVQQIIVERALG